MRDSLLLFLFETTRALLLLRERNSSRRSSRSGFDFVRQTWSFFGLLRSRGEQTCESLPLTEFHQLLDCLDTKAQQQHSSTEANDGTCAVKVFTVMLKCWHLCMPPAHHGLTLGHVNHESGQKFRQNLMKISQTQLLAVMKIQWQCFI